MSAFDISSPKFRGRVRSSVFFPSWIGLLVLGGVGYAESSSKTTANEENTFVMRVGLSDHAFRYVNYNDASAAYGLFLKRLANTNGYETVIDSEIFSDFASFNAAIERKQDVLNICSIPAWDFLSMNPSTSMEPRFVSIKDGMAGRSYVVLTRRDRDFTTLSDLRQKPITRSINTTTGGPAIWLETELLEAGVSAPDSFFGEVTLTQRPSHTILPVFFGSQSACIVDEPSFKLMSELNPQVGEMLRIVARSDKLADVVMCVNQEGWPTPQHRAEVIESVPNLGKDATGRQILTLFKIDRLAPFTEAHLDSLRALRTRWLKTREGVSP